MSSLLHSGPEGVGCSLHTTTPCMRRLMQAAVPYRGCLCCAFMFFAFFLNWRESINWVSAIQLQVATAHSYAK